MLRRGGRLATDGPRIGRGFGCQKLRRVDRHPTALRCATAIHLAMSRSPRRRRRSGEASGNGAVRDHKGGGSIWVVIAGVALAHAVVGAILLAAWLNGSTYFSKLIE